MATLQVISETLKEDPQASQRTLAKKANMSLGMMNAILGRFVERGWIMLSNVNGRKLAYAVTPEGILELANRGKRFALRTFKIANEYNKVLYEIISAAKENGKERVVLIGNSYIKFLLVYICSEVGIRFLQQDLCDTLESKSCYFIGDLEDDETQSSYGKKGCVSLLSIMQ